MVNENTTTKEKKGLSGGAIALIVVGIIIVILIVVILLNIKPSYSTGKVVKQDNIQSQTIEQIQLSQNNFYYMGFNWLGDSNYKDTQWCYDSYLGNLLSNTVYLKYKLINVPEKYQSSITCRVYDGTQLVRDNDNNGNGLNRNMDDPQDVRQIDIFLKLNQNHNLNICCYIFKMDNSIKQISNEVCFNQQVNKVFCQRNLDWENNYHTIPTYFTE
jgi:hypothetical protein